MLDDLLRTILTSATVSVALGGVAGALFKSLLTERLKGAIKAEYDAKLESHKSQLQASNAKELEVLKAQLKGRVDVELEQLKSQLQIQAAQHNLTFARLHEKRVEAIQVVYAGLCSVRDAVANYIAAFQPAGSSDKENLKAVEGAYKEFKASYASHQLFLPRNIANSVEQLHRTFIHVTNEFTSGVKAALDGSKIDQWIKLLDRFQNEVDEAVGCLREDMRIALGDKPASTVERR